MRPDLAVIGAAVADAQAVLQLVADNLAGEGGRDAAQRAMLATATAVAIARLDAVHDALQIAAPAAAPAREGTAQCSRR